MQKDTYIIVFKISVFIKISVSTYTTTTLYCIVSGSTVANRWQWEATAKNNPLKVKANYLNVDLSLVKDLKIDRYRQPSY